MARRYDPEFATAERFEKYLKKTLSEALQQASPVVTFFDPMAQDDAHRVVVMPKDFDTQVNSPQNWTGAVEIVVKSQLHQGKKMRIDVAAHFDRANELREAVLRGDLREKLDTGSVGLGFDFVSPEMKLQTDAREGWIYSAITVLFSCYARAAADDV